MIKRWSSNPFSWMHDRGLIRRLHCERPGPIRNELGPIQPVQWPHSRCIRIIGIDQKKNGARVISLTSLFFSVYMKFIWNSYYELHSMKSALWTCGYLTDSSRSSGRAVCVVTTACYSEEEAKYDELSESHNETLIVKERQVGCAFCTISCTISYAPELSVAHGTHSKW